tara:strand:- start:103 stop:423 length:321 start_codon:yes stop_codon:yes gene_type:complete
MYELALVELYNEKHHGETECSSINIKSNYMIVYSISLEEFFNNEYIVYKQLSYNSKKSFNDVNKLFENTSLEIVEIKELGSLEQIGIIKTFWLKIFQRKIKSLLIS